MILIFLHYIDHTECPYIGIAFSLCWLLFNELNLCFTFSCHLSISMDSKLSVRLTDNSLARDLFPHDYHCLGDNENRPIKWLAYESLVEHVFFSSSDTVIL